MSNDVKVEFDGDPYGNHQKMLEIFFDYINLYERYLKNPSQATKQKCRSKLYEIQKISKQLKSDLLEVHDNVLQLRQEVYEENKRQREIKKATKGN